MKLNEYQEKAMQTRINTSDNFGYMAFGLMAEAGEVADKVAKAIRKADGFIDINDLVAFDSKPAEFATLREGIKKELGDVLWFVAGLADVMGWTLEDVAAANLAKLADRQRRGAIVGEGDNR